MVNNTSQVLAQSIWSIANELRGSMDASKFKDYILGVIFYRYLSVHTETYMNTILENDGVTYREAFTDPDYMDDIRDWSISELGYVIEPQYLFDSFVNDINAGNFTIENFEKAITKLTESTLGERSEHAFENLFTAMNLKDTALGKEISDRTALISKIILKINGTNFAKDANAGDVLGTAYMILIGLFQSGAGKKGGEFFTPTCASTLLAQLTTIGLTEVKNVCDGCAGSGSLLLEVMKHLPSHKVQHFYGQEFTDTTYNLLRMNLIMHGVSYDKFTVYNDDTLVHDNFYDKETNEIIKFDIQVENPPYSHKNTAFAPKFLEDPRYKSAGVLAPKGKADLAFVETMVYHMADDGRVAVLLPHGVLFRGAAELEIRKYLIEKLNVIDAVIGLASKMFHGTGIPVCVLLLKKKRNGNSDNILFVDASKYYEKQGKNNTLRPSDIKRIVDCVKDRADIEHFSRKVSLDEIRQNDYNLNIPRYVDTAEEAEKWDMYSLMFGGIPKAEIDALDTSFSHFPGLKESLFKNEAHCYELNDDVKDIFKRNAAVSHYIDSYKATIADMRDFLKKTLIDGMDSVEAQKTEDVISNDLFERVDNIPLIDKYDAYQFLYDEWVHNTSDIDVIQREGLKVAKTVVEKKIQKKKGEEEEPDGFMGKILPFELVQKELLKDQLSELNKNRDILQTMDETLNELIEDLTDEDKEYSVGDNSIFDSDKNSIVPKYIMAADKVIKKEYGDTFPEEGSTELKITFIAKTLGDIKVTKAKVKSMEEDIEKLTINTIENLSDEQVLYLLEKKWIDPFIEKVSGLADMAINSIIKKIEHIANKYQKTYEEENREISNVEKELAAMMSELTGSEEDELGMIEFIKSLGGVAE